MKKLFTSLALLSLVSLVGCGGPSGTGVTNKVGGPGAKGDTDRSGSVVGQKDNTFSLDTPNLETNIKQGESKVIEIGISRGTNFDQDVTLSFADVPKGVSLDPSSPVLKKSEKNVKVTVKAADDAAIGHHVIKVTGKPASGPEASNTFKLEVKQK
jgi:uncharacterized membrane protein